MFENYNLEIVWYITLVQLWWIAVWGISYIVIDYVSKKYKITELFVYLILLTFVFLMILIQPNLLNHA